MSDMTPVIVPKSDQTSADDLIAGALTITITHVEIRPGTEQPVSIHFDGDNGRPWKPCKTVSRVLVAAWGPDANNYVGRTVRIYRDPNVTWAGMQVGGIRISHMSHIQSDMVMALTATRGKKAVTTIKPLKPEQPAKPSNPDAERADALRWVEKYEADVTNAPDMPTLEAVHAKASRALPRLATKFPDLHERALKLVPVPQGRPDDAYGDQFSGADEVQS